MLSKLEIALQLQRGVLANGVVGGNESAETQLGQCVSPRANARSGSATRRESLRGWASMARRIGNCRIFSAPEATLPANRLPERGPRATRVWHDLAQTTEMPK